MSLNCPKCQAPMQAVVHAGIQVDRCSACAGLWFDRLEAEDLKGLAGSEAIDLGASEAGQAHNHIDRIRCPRCRVPLVKMVVNGQPHIWYEACSVCGGTYFDAGEFRDFKTESLSDAFRAMFSTARP